MSGILVVALDCADWRLVNEWGCDNLLLDNAAKIETFAHSRQHPYTIEVWPTVATGAHPRDHGIEDHAQSWDNPVLEAGSKVTQLLPQKHRKILGRPFKDRGEGQSFEQTDLPHVFERGDVVGWPGLTEARNLAEAWQWMDLAQNGRLTERELDQRLFANMGEELLEAIALLDSGSPIVGVHSHILDVFGHVYADDADPLRRRYRRVDEFFAWVRDHVDNLVIMSDHGINAEWKGDEPVGDHSWEAMFATSMDGELPGDMFEVSEWVENRVAGEQTESERVVSATTEQQLQELGYI